MKLFKDMVIEGRNVIAQNVRTEGNEIIADGIFNTYVDANGDCHKKVEYIMTDDGDCVKLV